MATARIDPNAPTLPTTPPLVVPPVISAALDPTFGTGGVVTGRAGRQTITTVRRYPDGSLLLATVEDDRLLLFLHRENGSRDDSFGGNGAVVVTEEAASFGAAVTVQPDGRILVGTLVNRPDSTQAWQIFRFLPDGSRDTSFSADGRITLTFAGHTGSRGPRLLVVDEQFRILVVGAVGVADSADDNQAFAMARVLRDGSPDRSFGTEGTAILPLTGTAVDIFSAAVDSAGRIVACGTAFTSDTGLDFLVIRALPDGRLDPAFGVDGSTLVDFGIGKDLGFALAVQPDGGVVVAGPVTTADRTTVAGVVRLLPGGDLDRSFGVEGRARVTVGASDNHNVSAIRVLSDGRILVAGIAIHRASAGGNRTTRDIRAFVGALTPVGAPDPRMSGTADGIVLTPLNGMRGGAMAVLPDDRVVIAYTDTAMIRLLPQSPPPTALKLLITASQPVAGPGLLTFRATVRNDGPSPAAAQLNLVASKSFGIGSVSTTMSISHADPRSAQCTIPVLAPGQAAGVDLQVTVSGREGSVVVRGAVGSSTPDTDALDNAVTVVIQTFPVSPI